MSCPFCAIAAGEAPAALVTRDPAGAAFLDARPVFHGHTLVVPAIHVETLADLPAERLAPFFSLVQRVSLAVERGLAADGTFVAMNNRVSQSVPHLHAHVIPRRRKDGLRGFFWPRVAYPDEQERERVRAAISAALAG